MKTSKSFLRIAVSAGLLLFAACSSGNQTSTPANSPIASQSPTTTPAAPAANASANHDANHKAAGGMVVESGIYHLELAPAKEGDATHLDLFLQKGDNHEPVPNAKVNAQVQLPDGTQKSVEMVYDAAGKHYAAKLPTVAVGEYKVVVQTQIGSEKVNARYTFRQ